MEASSTYTEITAPCLTKKVAQNKKVARTLK